MSRFIIVLSCLAITATVAAPAKDELLDKATVNDVAVNSISLDKIQIIDHKEEDSKVEPINDAPQSTSSFETDNNHDTKSRPASMFARIIDDIFQIPISVLQSVARLLRNPFISGHKNPSTTPEAVAPHK